MSEQYAAEMGIDLGEKIHVKSVIKPKCEQDLPFKIHSARWELQKQYGEVEDSGNCEIAGHEIDAFIAPMSAAIYILRYIYEIADETWVDTVKIKVS